MFLYLPARLDFYLMNLYNTRMNDTNDLEPVDVEKLLANFSDYTIAELVMEIKQLRSDLEQEKKVVAAKDFKLKNTEEELTKLKGRINTATAVLSGDSDICIDCEAVAEHTDDKDE